MKTSLQIAFVMMTALALGGCDSRKPEAKKDVPPPGPTQPPNPTPALREETKKLEGAAAIGVNSKTLRRNVDKILDSNDERNKQLQEAAKPLDQP
jgi:hypothetical protein